jgi:hypothetical protein
MFSKSTKTDLYKWRTPDEAQNTVNVKACLIAHSAAAFRPVTAERSARWHSGVWTNLQQQSLNVGSFGSKVSDHERSESRTSGLHCAKTRHFSRLIARTFVRNKLKYVDVPLFSADICFEFKVCIKIAQQKTLDMLRRRSGSVTFVGSVLAERH